MYREYYTLNPLNSRPFLFKIHPLTSMIDLSKIYVITQMAMKEVDTDGSLIDISENEILSSIQMPGATFIKDLRVLINQKEIYNSNQLYSYKTYIDTELSFSKAIKDSYLTCSGYAVDDKEQNSQTGAGYIKRKNMFAKSRKAEFLHKLNCDIFNTDLFLISNTELDIEITPQSDEFMIMQKEQDKPTTVEGKVVQPPPLKKFKLEILNIKLVVKTLDLMDSLSLQLAEKLNNEPARYPIKKTNLKSLFISQGRTDFVANLFTEEVPRRIIVGLVANKDFVGNLHTSPFNFNNFNIRDIEIMANGRVYPQVNLIKKFLNIFKHTDTIQS